VTKSKSEKDKEIIGLHFKYKGKAVISLYLIVEYKKNNNIQDAFHAE